MALDLIAPVLVIAWTVGRLLGPQLMYQGGGNPTHAWYGMAYAGQAGKRVPVPIFQALEDLVVYVFALWVERRIARRGGPIGIVVTAAVTLYGAARFNDEYVLLPHSTGGDIAVLVASLAFVGGGAALAGWLLWRDRGVAHAAVTDPWRAPVAQCARSTRTTTELSRIRRTRRASKSLKAVQRSQKPPTRPTRASEPVASRQLGRPTDRPWKLLDRQRGSTGRRSGSAIVTVG